MRRQFKCLIIIVLIELLLTACKVGGDGHDPIVIDFGSLGEFKEIFAEFMAYPSYIPFEFDIVDGSIPFNSATTKIKYKNLSKEKYKRTDIFYDIGFGYSKEINKNEFHDELYKLSYVACTFFPNNKIEQMIMNEKLESIEYDGYTIYYKEHLYSIVIYPESKNVGDNNWILLKYYMEFNDKVYTFSFNYDVKGGTSKEKFLELRDKLKEEALSEVIKSYESLKYENKD